MPEQFDLSFDPNIEEDNLSFDVGASSSTPSFDLSFDENDFDESYLDSSYKSLDELTPEEKEDDREGFWDSMPTVYKQAYNESLGGLLHEMMTGKKRYNLKALPPSMTRDVAAGFLSFFASKEDLGLLVGGAGVGGAVGKTALKGAAKLSLRGLSKRELAKNQGRYMDQAANRAAHMMSKRGNMSYKSARGIVDDVAIMGGQQSFILGTHDGMYEAAREVRDELIKSGENLEDLTGKTGVSLWGSAFGKVMSKSDPMDYLKGGALGLAGSSARTLRFLPKVGTGTQFQGLMFESVAFGGITPLLYEGRAPTLTDFVMAAGVVGAISTPGLAGKYIKKKHDVKLGFEIEKEQMREMAKQAAILERQDAKGGFTMDTVSHVEPIKGTPVLTATQKSSASGSQVPIKIKPDKNGNVRIKIDEDTIRQTKSGDMTMAVVSDGQRYTLGPKNTEKVFKYLAEDPKVYRALVDEKKLRTLKGGTTKFDTVRNEVVIKELQRKANNRIDGYEPGDLDNAVKDMMNTRQFKRLESVKKKGRISNLELINKMNNSEKAILARKIDDAQYIRKFVNDNMPEANQRPVNITGGSNKDKGVFSRMLGMLKPAYDQVDSIYAKTAIRMIQEVSDNAQQKTAGRYSRIEKTLSISDTKNDTWWRNYLMKSGNEFITKVNKKTGKETKTIADFSSAWDDFNFINKYNVASNSNNGRKVFIKKLDKRILKATGEELRQAKLIKEFHTRTKKLTDEVWRDARGAGLNVAAYVDGYMPLMYKKEVLDVLFEGMSSLEQKVAQLTKESGFRLDGDYSKEQRGLLNREIEKLVSLFSAKVKVKDRKNKQAFSKVWNILSEKRKDGTRPDAYEVFVTLDQGIYNQTLKTFAPLERNRKMGVFRGTQEDVTQLILKTAPELYETNIAHLLADYSAGATKRIEMARAFTPSGKLLDDLIAKIGDDKKIVGSQMPAFLGGKDIGLTAVKEVDAVKLMKNVFTGEINWSKSSSFSKAFQSINNLEMMFKISSGFAVIPNVTQTLISSALISPMTAAKSMFNLARDLKVGGKKKVGLRQWTRDSGATIMTAFEDLMVSDPYLQIGAAQFKGQKIRTPFLEYLAGITANIKKGKPVPGFETYRDGISTATQASARWSGFKKINEWNQLIGAATAEDLVIKFTKILSGKKTGVGVLDTFASGQRKKWAEQSLKRMGITKQEALAHQKAIISRNYGVKDKRIKQKVLRSMTRFALDGQQQRSFMYDPILFNDPSTKPFFLFKRFGYRQAGYMKQELERELMLGNVMPILTMAIGGMAGGQGVMWAKEQYAKLLTGEEQYFGRENRAKLLEVRVSKDGVKGFGWQDAINGLANVGSFGIMSDVLTDEDPMSALEFFFMPVVIDDVDRILESVGVVWDNFNKYPDMLDVPFRKGAKKLSPLFGGIPSRFVRLPLETEAMTKERIRGYKRREVEYIRDLIEEGRTKKAMEEIRNFNNVYGRYAVDRSIAAKYSPLSLNLFKGKGLFREDIYRGYPGLSITPNDFKPNDMLKRYYKTNKRQLEEKNFEFNKGK
jgi:hypothetical protein